MSRAAVNVGGWHRLHGMEVLATLQCKPYMMSTWWEWLSMIVVMKMILLVWTPCIRSGQVNVNITVHCLTKIDRKVCILWSYIVKWVVEFRNFAPLIHLLRDFLSEQKIGIFCQRPTSRAPSKPCYYSLHTNEALSRWFTSPSHFPFHKSNG